MQSLSCTETGNLTQLFLSPGDVMAGDALPVGAAVPEMEILLLDDAGMPVAEGQVGEIVVRSAYLSPGYWRRPDLTAERFAEAEGGRRLYRTGDLGRFEAGVLFHMGRKDAQVKVRGYRIETAEVQRALEAQPTVERAAVWAGRGMDGAAHLAACVVPRAGCPVDVEALCAALATRLPSHMVPAIIHVAAELPLNAHGKIDLERLRAAAPDVPADALAAPPQTPTERQIADIWRRVLGREGIGREANFFALGGDSLSAAVAAARVFAVRGVALDLRAMADHPTLAALAAHVDQRAAEATPGGEERLTRVPRDQDLPLSHTQERIWRLEQSRRTAGGYTMACAYRIMGPLDVLRFSRCMNLLMGRHESLRTTFHAGRAGPVQRVHDAPPQWPLPVLDFTGAPDARKAAQEFLARDAARRFDLTQLPLARFHLVRVGREEHLLLRVSHHIMSDAWSWRLFFTELGTLYETLEAGGASPAEVPALGYADYAAWQRRTLECGGGAYALAVDWWAAQVTPPPPPLLLPFARRKALRHADPHEGVRQFAMEAGLLRRLDAAARARGVTAYALRLAALAALLARKTGQRDLVIGAYVTNRQRVETQGMFGNFANLTTLRLRLDSTASVERTILVVRDAVAVAQAHGEIPYEQLRAELRARRVALPEIQAIVAVWDRIARLEFGARPGRVAFSWMDRVDDVPWGFTLALDAGADGNACRITFDPRLHDPAGVDGFIGEYLGVLEECGRG